MFTEVKFQFQKANNLANRVNDQNVEKYLNCCFPVVKGLRSLRSDPIRILWFVNPVLYHSSIQTLLVKSETFKTILHVVMLTLVELSKSKCWCIKQRQRWSSGLPNQRSLDQILYHWIGLPQTTTQHPHPTPRERKPPYHIWLFYGIFYGKVMGFTFL